MSKTFIATCENSPYLNTFEAVTSKDLSQSCSDIDGKEYKIEVDPKSARCTQTNETDDAATPFDCETKFEYIGFPVSAKCLDSSFSKEVKVNSYDDCLKLATFNNADFMTFSVKSEQDSFNDPEKTMYCAYGPSCYKMVDVSLDTGLGDSRIWKIFYHRRAQAH